MATSLGHSPYAMQQVASYGYVQTYQPPPSPPMDDAKCSLPSISNLLGLADAGSPTSETSHQSHQQQAQSPQHALSLQSPQSVQQPQPQHHVQMQFQQHASQGKDSAIHSKSMKVLTVTVSSPAPSRPVTRPSSAHYSQPVTMRGSMPPTPPMGSEASFDNYPSPAAKSISGVHGVSGPGYYYETTPPLEEPRHMSPALGRLPLQTSYPQQSFGSPYMTQPALASYYPPMQPTPPPQSQITSLYYQRPFPQVCTFP